MCRLDMELESGPHIFAFARLIGCEFKSPGVSVLPSVVSHGILVSRTLSSVFINL